MFVSVLGAKITCTLIKFGGNTKLGGLILLRMAYSSLEKSKITLLSQVI